MKFTFGSKTQEDPPLNVEVSNGSIWKMAGAFLGSSMLLIFGAAFAASAGSGLGNRLTGQSQPKSH